MHLVGEYCVLLLSCVVSRVSFYYHYYNYFIPLNVQSLFYLLTVKMANQNLGNIAKSV